MKMDLRLAKINMSGYFQKDNINIMQIGYNGEIFFDTFKKVDSVPRFRFAQKHFSRGIHEFANARILVFCNKVRLLLRNIKIPDFVMRGSNIDIGSICNFIKRGCD